MSGSSADPEPLAPEVLRAAEILRHGGLVVFPTETVYGLGANAFNAGAVERIYTVKGRPADNPLIVHLASTESLNRVVIDPPKIAFALFDHFSPGPLTVVLRRHPDLPGMVSAGLPTVAVRIPRHRIARAFIEAAGVPVAGPSANRSGRPSPTDLASARTELGNTVECYLDGGPCDIGLESTVLRLRSEAGERRVEILREGGVTREALTDCLEALPVGSGWRVTSATDEQGESPGTRHAHYRPSARVAPFEASTFSDWAAPLERAAVFYLSSPISDVVEGALYLRRFDSSDDYAQQLYRCFREADKRGCDVIYVELPAATGIGRALRDRILRSAGRGMG